MAVSRGRTDKETHMAQREQFDILVLGSGKSGKLLAWHLAQSGRRTAVVERQWIGGSCPNVACLPTKNEIWSARVGHLARQGARFGVVIGDVTTDMARVRQRKRDMVQREIDFHLQTYKSTGTELIMGSGRFVAPKTLEVQLNDGGTRVLAGDRVFLNVGTRAAIPAIPGRLRGMSVMLGVGFGYPCPTYVRCCLFAFRASAEDEKTEMPRAQTSNPSMTDVLLSLAMTMEFLHRFLSAPGNLWRLLRAKPAEPCSQWV